MFITDGMQWVTYYLFYALNGEIVSFGVRYPGEKQAWQLPMLWSQLHVAFQIPLS